MRASLFGGCFSEIQIYQILRLFCPNSCPFFSVLNILGEKVRVAGIDGAYELGWKKKQPVLVVIDMGTGEPVTLGYVDEKDSAAVQKFLEPLVQEYGISVIITDDLFSYKKVADNLKLEHQVCQFHVRRWVGSTLHDLKKNLPEEWLWMIDKIREILSDLPIEGDKNLQPCIDNCQHLKNLNRVLNIRPSSNYGL